MKVGYVLDTGMLSSLISKEYNVTPKTAITLSSQYFTIISYKVFENYSIYFF